MTSYLLQETGDYLLQETGDKIILQEMTSVSLSPSLSLSLSPSLSESLSVSLSPSISISLSISPSPSTGYTLYSRGDEVGLPTNTNDLETVYSDAEEVSVSTRNEVYVGQTGILQNMVHQFKTFVDSETFFTVEWEGRSSLSCVESPTYLQIFNHTDNTWETIDSNTTTPQDINFELTKKIRSVSDYVNGGVVSCRVYQYATE